jgi:hypothetical protein
VIMAPFVFCAPVRSSLHVPSSWEEEHGSWEEQ